MPSRIPYYQSGGDNIAALLMRQGDIQANRAMQTANIWGNVVQNLGQIGAQAYSQYREKKDETAAVEDAFAAWDGKDPLSLYRGLATKIGPERAMRLVGGYASMMRLSQAQEPDPVDFKTTVGALAALPPEFVTKHWQTIAPTLAPSVKKFLGFELPPEPSEEILQAIPALDAKLNGKEQEGALVDTVDAQGRPVKRRATPQELAVGVPLAPKEATPPSPGSFDAFVASRYPQGATPEQMLQARGEWGRADDRPRDPLATAVLQGRLDDQAEKEKERRSEIEAYTSAVASGDYTIDKVPAPIQRAVMVEAERRGLDTRTGKQKEVDSAAEQTIESLKQLREQAQRTMTATTGPGAVIQGKLQGALNVVGLAHETRAWEKQAAKLSLLARQLGEKGVLTDRDVERVINMLPKLTDPTDIRDKALKDMEDIIFTGLRGRVSARVKLPDGGATDAAGAPPRPPNVPANYRWDPSVRRWRP